jgi:hypothetical protein
MSEPKILNAGSSGEWGWHATELALRCPQLFAYHHRLKGVQLERDRTPLIKGSLVHQGLAHHYARMQNAQGGRDPDEWAVPDVAIEACADALNAEAGDHEAWRFVDMAKQAVREYVAHYATEELDVLSVEEVFSANIAGRRFTQRFDLVVRLRATGKVLIFDHKTTGRISGRVSSRYTLSGQFLGMAMFGRELWGDGFGGVIINLVGLPQGPGERSEFDRVSNDPAPHALRLFPLSVQHARERIEALDASGVDPWEWPKALSEQTCITPYGKCDGFNLCRWGKR